MIEQYESDRFCNGCRCWKKAEAFPVRKDRKCGRYSRCIECVRAYHTAYGARRRKGDTGRREPIQNTPVPVRSEFPQMRVTTRLRKWRYPVNETTRFGVAMIGGGYV